MHLERLKGRGLYGLSVRLRRMKREKYNKHKETYDTILKEMDRLMWGEPCSEDVDRVRLRMKEAPERNYGGEMRELRDLGVIGPEKWPYQPK